MTVHPDSLLAHLRALPDPRRREGQRYPHAALLGLLVLGMLHGKTSLRACWVWGQYQWPTIGTPLGFVRPAYPARTTFWDLVRRMDYAVLEALIGAWLEGLLGRPLTQLNADGKVLRGSKRDDLPAVHLVALAQAELGAVVRQQPVGAQGGEVAALLSLLRERPLAGQVVTLDAGLLCAEVTQVIRAQGGEYAGVVKANQAEVKEAVDLWLREAVFSPAGGAAGGRGDDG